MSEDKLEEEWQLSTSKKDKPAPEPVSTLITKPTAASWFRVGVGWLAVGMRLAWGIMKTGEKASSLFH